MVPENPRRAPHVPPQPKPPGKCRPKATWTGRQETDISRKEACVAALQSSGGVDRTLAAYSERARKHA
eukprot:3260676-Pyramimonas_sp.AAC.1